MLKLPTVEVITLSDSTRSSPIKVLTSDNKYDFMVTLPNSPEIPPNIVSTISTPKIDKAVQKIHKLKSTPTLSSSPILNIAIPDGITTQENREQCGSEKTENANELASTSNAKTQNENEQTRSEEYKEAENDRNEEHYKAATSPGKSSISDIKPDDFYEEELNKWNSSRRLGECGTRVPISPNGDNKLTTKFPKSSIYKHW